MIARIRPHRWALAAVGVSVLLGLYVRLVEGYVEPVADASTYVTIASGLTTHPYVPGDLDWSVGGLAMRGITYPLFIAAMLTLTGTLSAVVWVQSLVFVPATVWLLYAAGRRALGAGVGLVAAWIYALWVPAQVYSSVLMQETWLALLTALLLYLLSRVITGGGGRWSLATGLLVGVMAVTHSAFQIVGLVLVFALFFHWLAYDRRRLKQAVIVAVGLFAILVPSVLVRAAFDLPQQGEGSRGYGSGGGWTFWVASQHELGFWPPIDGWKFANLTQEGQLVEVAQQLDAGSLVTDPHLSAIIQRKADSAGAANETLTDGDFYRAGLANLMEDPAAWPRKVGLGIRTLTTIPKGMQLYRDAPSSAAVPGPWTFLAGSLLAAAAAGLVCLIARRRDRLVLAVPFLVQFSVLILAFPENRHAIPLWGSMALLTAVMVSYARQTAQRMVSPVRDARGAIRVALAVTLGIAVVTGGRSVAMARPLSSDPPSTKAGAVFDRMLLTQLVFDTSTLPEPQIEWHPAASALSLDDTATVNSAVVPLRFGLTSKLVEYVPATDGDCGLIVHGGHASWTEGGGKQVAQDAVTAGCRVIVVDMPGMGVNGGQVAQLSGGYRIAVQQADELHNAFWSISNGSRNALDVYLTPVIAAVDRLENTEDSIAMAGLSGGAWTTSLAAALDPRIEKSLAVAGSTTVDVTQPCAGDYEQCLPELYKRASMEQLYTLAATGPDREHVQILNYYDPCCFAGNDGMSWVPGVKEAVAGIDDGGKYEFLADRTEPGEHAYPPVAFDILQRWESATG